MIVKAVAQFRPWVKSTVVNASSKNRLAILPQKLIVGAVPGWRNVTTVTKVVPFADENVVIWTMLTKPLMVTIAFDG